MTVTHEERPQTVHDNDAKLNHLYFGQVPGMMKGWFGFRIFIYKELVKVLIYNIVNNLLQLN